MTSRGGLPGRAGDRLKLGGQPANRAEATDVAIEEDHAGELASRDHPPQGRRRMLARETRDHPRPGELVVAAGRELSAAGEADCRARACDHERGDCRGE